MIIKSCTTLNIFHDQDTLQRNHSQWIITLVVYLTAIMIIISDLNASLLFIVHPESGCGLAIINHKNTVFEKHPKLGFRSLQLSRNFTIEDNHQKGFILFNVPDILTPSREGRESVARRLHQSSSYLHWQSSYCNTTPRPRWRTRRRRAKAMGTSVGTDDGNTTGFRHPVLLR